MSDPAEVFNRLSAAIRACLEDELAALIATCTDGGEPWTLPTIGDFVCVVVVEDAGEDVTSLFEVSSHGPRYRKVGLLSHALMDYTADLCKDGL